MAIKYYTTSACGQCSILAQCTHSKEGERLARWINEDLLCETQRRARAGGRGDANGACGVQAQHRGAGISGGNCEDDGKGHEVPVHGEDAV